MRRPGHNDLERADRADRSVARTSTPRTTRRQSAYLITTSEGYLDLLDLTLAHGARVDDKDSWNGTGLIRAAERGHALVVGTAAAAPASTGTT